MRSGREGSVGLWLVGVWNKYSGLLAFVYTKGSSCPCLNGGSRIVAGSLNRGAINAG